MKKILMGLVVLLSLVACVLLAKILFFSEPVILDKSVQDMIRSIEGVQVTLDNGQVFDITDSKKDQENYYVDDIVTIEYSVKEGKDEPKPILATSISLIQRDEKKLAIKQALDSMSLEEKVAQMFFARCPTGLGVESLEQYQLGGYILFDQDIQNTTPESFKQINESYQNTSKHGLFIGIDEEGGIVNRLSWYPEFRQSPFLSPQDLNQIGGLDAIQSDTVEKSQFLKNLGINVNFAPVADISQNPYDFIYSRTFGQDANATSEYVQTVVRTMKENGMSSVLKHFPGYGNNVDTHTGSAYDKREYSQFESSDFIPFQKGIEAGSDFVLVSHNVVTSMDDTLPASLSAKVHSILREKLGFDGIVITDDLIMQAISGVYGVDESAILAIQAGNDMIITQQFDTQIPSVVKAIQDGRISKEQIDESVYRILSCKYDLGILK